MALDFTIDQKNLDRTDYFQNKIIQLYNTKLTRHGVILVGESMSGKSEIIKVLKGTLGCLN